MWTNMGHDQGTVLELAFYVSRNSSLPELKSNLSINPNTERQRICFRPVWDLYIFCGWPILYSLCCVFKIHWVIHKFPSGNLCPHLQSHIYLCRMVNPLGGMNCSFLCFGIKWQKWPVLITYSASEEMANLIDMLY